MRIVLYGDGVKVVAYKYNASNFNTTISRQR